MSLTPRLGALGAGLLIAGAVGAGAATVALDHGATAKVPAATADAARPVSDSDSGTARRVYATATDSVAFISASTPQGQATGSGFVVSADGKIVTNEHVVDGAQQVTVKIGANGAEQPARVLAADASKDLALLQVDAGGKALKPLRLADSSQVQVGQPTYAIGNPYGLDHTLTSGIVSALGRQIEAPDGTAIGGVIQTDAAINPGNSGGALLDAAGHVIGVNSQIATGSGGSGSGNVGIGFAIPSNTVANFVAHPSSTPSTQEQQQAPTVDPYGNPVPPDSGLPTA